MKCSPVTFLGQLIIRKGPMTQLPMIKFFILSDYFPNLSVLEPVTLRGESTITELLPVLKIELK